VDVALKRYIISNTINDLYYLIIYKNELLIDIMTGISDVMVLRIYNNYTGKYYTPIYKIYK